MVTRRGLDAQERPLEGGGDKGGERRPARPPEQEEVVGRRGWPAGEENSNLTPEAPQSAGGVQPPLTDAELLKLRKHMALWPG